MFRWLRSAGQVLGMLALEVVFLVVLYWSGPYLGSVPLHHLGPWLHQTASQESLWAIARLVCIVAGWWLLASTVAYLLAALVRREGRPAGQGWRFVSLPLVRKLVEGAVGVSMLASTVAASASGASAATMRRPAVVQTVRPQRGVEARARSSGRAGRADSEEAVRAPAGVRRHLAHPGVLVHTVPVLASATPNPAAPSEANGFAGLPAGTKVVVVQRWDPSSPGSVEDCLSVIAQRHLDDWRLDTKIFSLNVGRVQADGRSLQDDNWIQPGWVLIMPPEAHDTLVVGAAPAGAAPAPAASPTVSSAPAGQVAVTPAASPTTPGNGGAGSTPTSIPATSIPATSIPATSIPASRSVGLQQPSVSGSGSHNARNRGRALPRESLPGWLLPWAAGGGATLLATWALVEAQRRRARRLRQSLPGFVMPPGDPTVAPVTTAVRAASDMAAVDRVQAALYHLATVGDSRLRPVVLLRHPDGRIDVQLFSVAEPVAPWTATDDLFWALDPCAELPEPDPLVTPCPALVQIGVCDDGAQLFVDLEAVGILGLAGTAETVRQVARALTATLAVSPATQLCRVLTLGFDSSGLSDVEDRFVVARSVESLLHEAEMTAKQVVRGIAERGSGSSFRLRAIDPDCGWEPTVVVVAGITLTNEEVSRLERLAGDGGQGAAVVCAGADAVWSLELVDPGSGWWELKPLGLKVRPVQMAADELRELAAYLADADMEPVEMSLDAGHFLQPTVAERVGEPARVESAEPSVAETADLDGDGDGAGLDGDVTALEEPADSADQSAAPEPGDVPTMPDLSVPPEPVGSRYVEPEWSVMVRLFGPPDAINRDGVALDDGGRDKPLELLAWLVTHRHTATRSGAREALWGGDEVAGRTMSNALWGARKLLRNLADEPDEEFITTSATRLLLSPKIVSDYDLVADRLAFARRLGDAAGATEALAGGLHLVRGAPLAGEKWLWADENHLSTNLAMLGSAVATELAAQRLKAGQTETAIDATTVGLEVIPNNEELIRLRMQACIDGGDRRAALNVYEKYVGVTTSRGERIGPAIAALRNELLRTSRK
ncbi:MAG: hypothetical protein M3083_18075 [Actinomycetota bacterium]|nr:hypothetical protein [Actinomycetota bacterium]